MQTEDIKDAVRSFVKQRFNIAPSDTDFNDDVHLFDYGYVDSFGAVELTQFVAKHCAIQVSSTDLIAHPLATINQIATFAHKRLTGEI